MRISTLRTGAIAAALSAVMVVGACSANDGTADDDAGETTDAGTSEPLTIYSARSEDQVSGLVELFTEETGIPVEVFYGDDFGAGKLLLEHEADNVEADLFWSQEAGSLATVAEAGVPVTLPDEIMEKVPAQYSDPNGDWVGLSGRMRVIAYNSEALSEDEVPDSILDFADPVWNDRVDFAPSNGSFQLFVTALRAAEGEDAAREWLEGMAQNVPDGARPEGNSEVFQLVEDGQIEVGFINHYRLHLQALEEGGMENLVTRNKIAEPGDIGSMINVTGIMATSDNPDALEFIDFLLSEEAQRWISDETSYEYPLIEGVEPQAGLPPLDGAAETMARFDLTSLSDREGTEEMLREVGLL